MTQTTMHQEVATINEHISQENKMPVRGRDGQVGQQVVQRPSRQTLQHKRKGTYVFHGTPGMAECAHISYPHLTALGPNM